MDFNPEKILGAEGLLVKKIPNFESRPQQVQLSCDIRKAMLENKHLIAEAPTGVGKSFAFLIPAIEIALLTKTPVVISTHTINLQEQLFDKDVPFLKKYLNLPDLKVVLAKGRANYISLRRYQVAKNQIGKFAPEDRKQMDQIDKWLDTTVDGSLSSLRFRPNPKVWNRIKSDSDQCYGEKCHNYKKCFFQGSRRELETANIIITNHSLVLLDRRLKIMGQKLLPEYNYLVLDEAHELEEVARSAFTFELEQQDIKNLFFEAYNDVGSGFINHLENEFIGANLFPTKVDQTLKQAVLGASKLMGQILQSNDDFFQKSVNPFLGTTKVKRMKNPGDVKTDLNILFGQLNGYLKVLSSSLTDKDEKIVLESIIKRSVEIAEGLEKVVTLPKASGRSYPENVAWAFLSEFNGKSSCTVSSAPIFVKPLLKAFLFNAVKSVILTSATLTTGGNDPFKLFRSSVGLDDTVLQRRVGQVFDYQKQAKMYIVSNMPEQSHPDYCAKLSEQVKKYVTLTKGNAFILFTSFKTLNEVYKATHQIFEMQGMKTFVQGGDLSRKQMLEDFKKTPNSVLFGTSSFWTGCDVPGDNLQNVIITKLPFDRPDDPLAEAQEEVYKAFNKNYFMERSLPKTAIDLKQGFGRLIRTKTDHGIIVILDSRLVTKKYGSFLLNSLPKCPTERVSI